MNEIDLPPIPVPEMRFGDLLRYQRETVLKISRREAWDRICRQPGMSTFSEDSFRWMEERKLGLPIGESFRGVCFGLNLRPRLVLERLGYLRMHPGQTETETCRSVGA